MITLLPQKLFHQYINIIDESATLLIELIEYIQINFHVIICSFDKIIF